MSPMKTSIATLIAAGFLAGGSLSVVACEWHDKQAQANASTPVVEKEQAVSATRFEPVQLARSQSPATVEKVGEN